MKDHELPTHGGSYHRQKDGSLKLIHRTLSREEAARAAGEETPAAKPQHRTGK